jgi:nucleotide-binding universal stress UspA family protein
MFSSIVVGTDGSSRSRQAVAVATELAKSHGAKLHLVRAFRPTLQTAALAAGDAMMALAPSTDAEVHAQVEEELERLAAEIEREGVGVQTYACPQAAPSAILSVATHQEADLIVIGSKGMHGARRVLGSVPNSIAHQASCAVMIVPTG